MQFSILLFVNAPTPDLTLSVSALVFLLCLALFLRPFQKQLSLSLGFWLPFSLPSVALTYFIWGSIGASGGIVVGTTVLYPFIFVANFRKRCLLTMMCACAAVISFLHLMVKSLKTVYANLHAFWITHFLGIWTVISAGAGILAFGVTFFNLNVPIIHSFPIGIFVFILFLYGIFLGVP